MASPAHNCWISCTRCVFQWVAKRWKRTRKSVWQSDKEIRRDCLTTSCLVMLKTMNPPDISLSISILLALLNVRKSVVLVVSVCNRQKATLFSVLKFILGTQREAHKKWNKNKTQKKSPLTQHDTKRSGNERETLRNTKRRSKKSNRLSLRDNAHESMWHINIACWIL